VTAQSFRLSGSEGDDAANRVVRRHANGDTIAGHDLDPEAAHPSAQLREHFMAGIALDAVQPTRVNGDHSPLHIDQIVFAQYLSLWVGAGRASPVSARQRRCWLAISVPHRGASWQTQIYEGFIVRNPATKQGRVGHEEHKEHEGLATENTKITEPLCPPCPLWPRSLCSLWL
jgi:hypothetical protein